MLKKAFIAGWLIFLSGTIAALFWYNEWVYSLPTPVPENYIAVPPGQRIDAVGKFNFDNSRPLFIHFFNPDCPCSRFNVAHFK
ncbi:MAG: AhpC/TSA family protein, partial [Bacteroidota bacterium]